MHFPALNDCSDSQAYEPCEARESPLSRVTSSFTVIPVQTMRRPPPGRFDYPPLKLL
jgi:hypothetical protein